MNAAVTHRRSRILIADSIADAGLDILAEHFDVDVRTDLDEASLVEIVGDYEAMVVRSATKVTGDVVAAAHRMKVIARAGAGLDTIDVKAALDRGIEVINSPDANTLAVAELTMGLVVALARNIAAADATMKAGKWEKSAMAGIGLAGKTLGIIGFGRIGQAVADRAAAFGMRVVANQRRPTPELYLGAGVQPLDLFDLLAQSDFVTVHVPGRLETEGLVDAEVLAAMKPTAYLINTARGSVVDETALAAALDAGQLAGAALDVWSTEPAIDHPLAKRSDVLATPHLGASTRDAQTSAAEDVARQLVNLLSSRPAESVLPLRFVSLDQVVPHEATDARRSARLAELIEEEQILRNPPIVAAFGDRYVVLDGATRTDALRTMGIPHVVVQDVGVDDGLGLETWHHVIRSIDANALRTVLSGVEGVTITECEPSEAADRVIESGALCSVQFFGGPALILSSTGGANRFDALASISDTYTANAVVSRTLERDVRKVAAWYPDGVALVEYPEFTVEQVLLAARSGRLLPAGVTRFLIPGRVLRLELPLAMLSEPRDLDSKNRWLHDHLAEKQRHGKIRYYREPVYLLDE
ncbi:MAG TPA: NAD(P)-dependent oxidoreductase [Acidimicrobiia bacterium]|nr:NAD(P)-dependent oxidoreductase [Acidimicrobiia bacterium]